MKKNYLQPAIKVVSVHHESPLLVDSLKVYQNTTVSSIDDLLVSP
jgi:hypothetical protein